MNIGSYRLRRQAPRAGGLWFTGHDDAGQVRIAELAGHPFYLATLFQPEPAGDGTRPHPVIAAFLAAAAGAGRPPGMSDASATMGG
ncbi:hypothetical protein SAMN05443665_102739 [Actinomadura meyerae]|jgi:CTP synthase (UTP-ammonia lyase)|uniref:Uncharacterized protein n=1 Tax=Actinomadura meyerae TaxID=240840 RepID=A0A239MAN4_9ACTN|nr:hypothetical protein [Actinomadura meyerae]SNT40037.1 hypothetical protein SAMN05443665_102739 [Actinomadura meyerae]